MRNYFQSAMTDPQTQRPGSDRVGVSTDTNTAPSVAAHAPTGSVEDLANYLTDGYWADNGGARHTFDTSTSNIITVNITGLTADGQRLARWAMEAWESVADIQFAEISGPAQPTPPNHIFLHAPSRSRRALSPLGRTRPKSIWRLS